MRVVEAWEHPNGDLSVWTDLDGHAHYVLIRRGAPDSRKLDYGLARLVRHVTLEGGRLYETEPPEIEHIDPDAEIKAHVFIYAEMLDRFEDTGFDWRTDTATPISDLAPDHPGREGLVERPDLLATHKIPKRAPAPFASLHQRFIVTGADGSVVETRDVPGQKGGQ